MTGASARTSPDREAEVTALIRGCAAGNHADFRRLYDLQNRQLYAVALRITRQAQLAEDVLHDAFLQVWRNASRFDAATGRAQPWLISIVRYRALDMVRRRSREVNEAEPKEQVDDSPDALDQLIGTRDGEALQRCLAQLIPERRALVVDAFVMGLSHAELAERRSLPLGTVKAWIRRSLIALRGCLSP